MNNKYANDMEAALARVTAERDAALLELSEIKESLAYRGSLLCRLLGQRDALQQRLTAAEEELDQCQSMALMIEEKEWAEHAGKGPISSQVESAFTQMHNELSESRQGLTAADERWDELVSAVRSINRSPHHMVKAIDDDQPQYRQRKEWIDWVLELCDASMKS